MQKNGLETVTMDEIVRQKNPQLLSAVYNIIEASSKDKNDFLKIREKGQNSFIQKAANLSQTPADKYIDTITKAPITKASKRTLSAGG